MANKKKSKAKKNSSVSKKSNVKSSKKACASKKKTNSTKKTASIKKKTSVVKSTTVKQDKTVKAIKSPGKANVVNDNASLSKLDNIKLVIVEFFKRLFEYINLLYSKCKNKLISFFDNFKKNNKKKNIKKGVSKKSNKSITKNKIEFVTNPFLKMVYKLWNNIHILFNSVLIITYLVLLIGLLRTDAFSVGAIVYVSCILIFLMIVGMCYSKYLSGKIFSLFIIVGMSFAIYQLQYTYDFFNNLNTSKYEYKEYYVVTFDNGSNKSIYNINNKRVGLLKDNSINVQRILNTKLDSVNYIEFDDPNLFYSAFFEYECRAIIVNANQYKYLTNYIEENSRNVKILYTFKANGLK